MKPVIAELSAGAIVYRKKDGETEILLLLNNGNHWDLAKGHLENKEKLYTGAKREVIEETGLTDIEIDPSFHYYFTVKKEFPKDISFKTYHIFIADAKNEEVSISDEHQTFKWVSVSTAIELLNNPGEKEAVQKAHKKGFF